VKPKQHTQMKTLKVLMIVKETRKNCVVYVAARRAQTGEWSCRELILPAKSVTDKVSKVSDEEYAALCEQVGDRYDFDCDAIDHLEIAE